VPGDTLYYPRHEGDDMEGCKPPRGGQSVQILPSCFLITDLAMTGNAVYVTPHPKGDSSTTIDRLRLAGGTVETIAEVPSPILVRPLGYPLTSAPFCTRRWGAWRAI
jgi:hypothetical protein